MRPLFIDARFVCRRCLSRGVHATCARCRVPGACVDLGAPEQAELLRDALAVDRLKWPAGGGLRGHWRRSSTSARVEWIVSAVATLGIVGAITLDIEDPELIWAPLLFAGFLALVRLTVFLGVLVLRLAGVTLALAVILFLLVGTVIVTREGSPARERLGARLGDLLQGCVGLLSFGPAPATLALAPAPRPGPVTALGPATSPAGVVSEPFEVVTLAGRAGSLLLGDAVAPPFAARDAEDRLFRVAVEVGSIALDRAFERASVVHPEGLAPWLAAAPAGATRRVSVPVGARVELLGGAWSDEASAAGQGGGFRDPPRERVLRGTREAPLHVRVRRG